MRHMLYFAYRLSLLMPVFRDLLGQVATTALNEHIVRNFVRGGYGTDYGVGSSDRARLVSAFQRSVTEIQSGTSVLQHIVMAQEILSIPPGRVGDVIECGVWKGASAVSLSLVCRLVGRRLLICDSFAGLPEGPPQLYCDSVTRQYGYLRPGMFAGSLSEVQYNMRTYGAPDVCEYLPGFFAQSLADLARPLVFAFIDVDLIDSVRDCVRAIWPLLVEGSAMYMDDVCQLELIQLFFNETWWQSVCNDTPPGFIGSGCGLPLTPLASNIGYTRKWGPFRPEDWRPHPQLPLEGDTRP